MTNDLADQATYGPTSPMDDRRLLELFDAQEGDSSLVSRAECMRNLAHAVVLAERARLCEALNTETERVSFEIACREVDERAATPDSAPETREWWARISPDGWRAGTLYADFGTAYAVLPRDSEMLPVVPRAALSAMREERDSWRRVSETLEREKNALRAQLAEATRREPLTGRANLALAEVERAVAKFPTWPTDAMHALAVLGEEVGELTSETRHGRGDPERSGTSRSDGASLPGKHGPIRVRAGKAALPERHRPRAQHGREIVSETKAEMRQRVELMATDDSTWDLSRNDTRAIRSVLDTLAAAERELDAVKRLGQWVQAGNTPGQPEHVVCGFAAGWYGAVMRRGTREEAVARGRSLSALGHALPAAPRREEG